MTYLSSLKSYLNNFISLIFIKERYLIFMTYFLYLVYYNKRVYFISHFKIILCKLSF